VAGIVRSLLLAGVVAFGLTGESVAQAQWQTVSNAERSFFAEMPAAPKHSSNKAKTGSGDDYVTDTYLVETGEEAFVVQTAVFPASVDTSDPRGNLQAGLDNAMKGMDGKTWKSVNWTSVQGLLAVDVVGMRNGHAIRTLSLMEGKRIVALTYAGPPGSANSGNATRFVKSLRLAR
jgi:hypothetical protein